QAMPEGGTITIAAENVQVDPGELLPLAPGPYVSILVHDTGCGIPKEIQKRIFEPFFTTKEKGSGLGLAVAHSIVKKHNGYLDVYSELGCGTTFSLFLPAEEAAHPPEAAPDSLPPKGTGRVLVMDDEEMVLHSTGAMLAHLGYTPVLARDGREAIDVCTRAVATGEKLLAVIMDLTIPGGMGGVEAQREISRIAPDLPLIVSSGYSNDPVLARFREFGFAAFLVKPFHLRDLAQTLARQNRPARTAGADSPAPSPD
ncbi:MAG TPA: ATP-binding protein, partial [Candidatus Aminicenantes bacterium]|nr:ATP-binding protein [Candidatus Aminicenantes bacterium]